MTQTPTPAAPSGELPEPCHHRIVDARNPVVTSGYICMDCGAVFAAGDHPRRAAVSQAAPEQAEEVLRLHRELAGERLRADQGWARYESANAQKNKLEMAAARALAAPSGAPKQENEHIEFLAWVLNNRIEMWEQYVFMVDDARAMGNPIGGTDEDDCRERIKKARAALAFVNNRLAAASTVQSAPVLPADTIEMALCESVHLIPRPNAQYIFRVRPGCVECARLAEPYGAAQSTPVQVDGQQEQTLQPSCDSALHAEPAGQHVGTFTGDLPETVIANIASAIEREIDSQLEASGMSSRDMQRQDGDAILSLVLDELAAAGCIELDGRCRAQGGIDEPNSVVQALALPVAAAPEQKP